MCAKCILECSKNTSLSLQEMCACSKLLGVRFYKITVFAYHWAEFQAHGCGGEGGGVSLCACVRAVGGVGVFVFGVYGVSVCL